MGKSLEIFGIYEYTIIEAIKIARQEQGVAAPCPLTRKRRPSIPTALQPHACSCYYTPFFAAWQVPGGQFMRCSGVGMGSSIPIAALFFVALAEWDVRERGGIRISH